MPKPLSLFQNQAPTAMSNLGAGLAQTGADIGRMYQQGYASLGQSIGGALQSIGSSYGQYNQAKTNNDMMKSILDDPLMSQQVLGIPNTAEGAQIRDSMKSNMNQMIKDHGQYGAAQATSPYLQSFLRDAQIGKEYQQKINLAQATAQAQYQYSPKAVRFSSFEDDGSLQPQPPQQTDPVTGNMNLNAPDQGGADQNLPLFGGQSKTGISDWFSKTLTPKPFTIGGN